jgi:dihydroflavonol-4-reductase
MAETVLVTGGNGFVAGWCIAELLKRGYTVRTTVRSLAKEAAVRAAVAPVAGSTDRLSFFTADLTKDEGWDAAMTGCDYVLHVASPLGTGATGNPDDLIIPAREGTLRVLRAAVKAGVKRVVMTSSAAASNPGVAGDTFTDETVWTPPDHFKSDAYRLSKLLAERAAWDFMNQHGGATQFTTILPTAIFGPVLAKDQTGSVEVIKRLYNGGMPRAPNLGVAIIDVRDLADVHIKAMTSPAAAGERFLATGEFMWMSEIAATLRARLGARAAKAPTKVMPDFVFRLAAAFRPELRALLPLLGRKNRYSWAKAERLLGFKPRPAADTVTETAESLMAAGG